MNKYYYCIDVGGTDIKAGIIDESHKILFTSKTPTNSYFKKDSLADTLIDIIKELLEVDHSSWLEDVENIKAFYKQVGERVPTELHTELKNLEERLKQK